MRALEVVRIEGRLDRLSGPQQVGAEDSRQQPGVERGRQPLGAELEEQIRPRALGELTALVDLSDWPTGTRLIVRREPLHPGAQQSLFPSTMFRYWGHYTDAAGDPVALEDLLGVVRPRILAVCRGVLPHGPDAEDACQEALLSVATKVGSWHGRGRFTTWLHVVALNSARSTYRRLKRQAVAVDPAEGGRLERPDPRTTSVIAGTRLDLLEAMEAIGAGHPQVVDPLVLRWAK